MLASGVGRLLLGQRSASEGSASGQTALQPEAAPTLLPVGPHLPFHHVLA